MNSFSSKYIYAINNTKESFEDSYPKCPRCQGNWTANGYVFDCYACGMGMIPSKKCFYLKMKELYYLHWDIENNRCVYGKINSLKNSVTLPMLGFDIGLEKLELYILFS